LFSVRYTMSVMATVGRPRSFDRDTALERAMLAFWERGYDGTSISDLTNAMGIEAPSLYAAFGDKKQLFEEAVRRYGTGPGSFTAVALAEAPTARAAVERLLHEAASNYTRRGRPRGCMVISANAQRAPESEQINAHLRKLRQATDDALRQRIADDVATGELPTDTNAAALATFVSTVIAGMSNRARDGATRQQLQAVAKTAMAAWPEEPTKRSTPSPRRSRTHR